jgi:hypothetical protein
VQSIENSVIAVHRNRDIPVSLSISKMAIEIKIIID